jgi:ELWxxDGT repeat protein
LEPRLLLATGPASMVKDIDPVSNTSGPGSFIAFKGATYFVANDGIHGLEWFRTDGTSGGTSLLADLNPGSQPSVRDVDRDIPTAAVLGDALYFTAYTPSTGNELWKTDGTAAGTVIAKDIRATGSSTPMWFTVVGDTLYFTASDLTYGRQLWKTDGTEAGTQRLTDIPNTDVNMAPVPLAALGGRLVFSAKATDPGGTSGRELWITDGTPAGTTLLADINPSGGSEPGVVGSEKPSSALVNGELYFAATDAATGRELWKTNGTTAGTVRVADLTAGTASSSPMNLINVNGTLYFTRGSSGPSVVWRRDPVSGTIAQIGPVYLPSFGNAAHVASVGNVGGVFYLSAWWQDYAALFKHDPASPASPLTVVKQLTANHYYDPMSLGPIVDMNGAAVFLQEGPYADKSIQLWRSDGTAAGTVPLATFQDPRTDVGSALARWQITRGGDGTFYFAGTGLNNDMEPWRTDGTAAGTTRVANVNGGTFDSNPTAPRYLGNGRWVFAASDWVHGRELWVTDGTEAGTSLLSDISPDRSGVENYDVVLSPALDGRTYFDRFNTGGDGELWTTDGTAAGTKSLSTFGRGFGPRAFAALGGRMYFNAGDATTRGLWVTDGTEAGTHLVTPLAGINSGSLVRLGDLLYFTAYESGVGGQLWKTDGTTGGTQLVSVFANGAALQAPVVMDGALYFTALPSNSGYVLFRSDGTAGGTGAVANLPAALTRLVVAGHKLFLSRRGSQQQPAAAEVWVSDGTAGGTFALTSAVPELAGFTGDASSPAYGEPQLLAAGDAAYFFGKTPGTGLAVWRTDGTAAGTRRLFTSTQTFGIRALGAVDGDAYFSVGGGLWRTDGTETGTMMLEAVSATNMGDPADLIPFSGTDALHGSSRTDVVHGAELWAMPHSTTVPEVYVRGSAWAGSFKSYLDAKGLGDDRFGYRVDDKPEGGVVPWVNVDELVVRFPAGQLPGGGVPTPGTLKIQSQRGAAADYAVTRVDPVPGDPQAFVFVLNRPLGGEGADAGRNGDHLTLTVSGVGPRGTALNAYLNVVQGDVDGSGMVLAQDFSAVKKKFFKDTTSAAGNDASAGYDPLHDVDGSGDILANDFAEVKKRFFQTFPSEPTAAAAAALPPPATVIAPDHRTRPVTRDLFSRAPLLR